MKTGKVWGTTELMIATPLFEAHRLSINPKSFCSMHMHRRKFNAFIVLRGKLFIDVKKNDYDLVDTTVLRAGEMTTVQPGEFHRFRTASGACEAFEFYYLAPLANDIERKNVGGKGKAK